MTITERLMKPGSFRVQLREDYLFSVAAAVDVFDHIIITPTRLLPIEAFSDANILDQASYVGVITAKPSPRTFGGYGLAWWLGTPDGLGDLLDTAVTGSSQTLTQWITALCPASLTVGTVTNTGGSTSATYQWITRREAIDAVCRAHGAEWRVNPDGTLDVGPASTLWPSYTTPTVVITRKEEGQDGAYRGLDGSLIVTGKDVESYTTEVIVVAQGDGTTTPTASATGSTSYVDLLNGAVVLKRLIDSPTDTSTSASTVATLQLGRFNQVARDLAVTSRTYDVTSWAGAGDYVYIYDQLAELSDSSVQITYRGEVITPLKVRVQALTWPVEQGMGVYARRSGATPVYTDLTDYVEWETSTEVMWELSPASGADAPTRAAAKTGQTGRVAYLGDNPKVAERTAQGSGPTGYAPTLTATTTNPNLGATGTADGDYHIANGRCWWRATFVFNGAGVAAGSGNYRVLLPATPDTTVSGGFSIVGEGWYFVGGAFYPVVLDQSPGGTSARIIANGAEVTNALPAAPTAGAVLSVHGDFPIA